MSRVSRRLVCCLLVAFGLAGSTVRAAKVEWRNDLKAAARESARTGKPMLLKFTASWCGYCHKMEATTYSDEGIVRHVNDCFIPVKIDADQNEELTKALEIRGLPTTVVVSPQMKVLSRIKGYKSADVVGKALTEVCQVNHEEPAADTRIANKPVAGGQAIAARPAVPAFGGHCLVTLRKERRLEAGDPRTATTYRNVTVAFANDAAREEFVANPEFYWPMWDGNCPVASVDENRTVEGLPATGAIYRDRLWFFADRTHREEFDAAPSRYVPNVAAEPETTRTR